MKKIILRKETKMTLINRYDIRKNMEEKQANSLVAAMQKELSPTKKVVIYTPTFRNGIEYETRMQVPHYNVDEVIKYLENKIKADTTVLKTWEYSLTIIKRIKRDRG